MNIKPLNRFLMISLMISGLVACGSAPSDNSMLQQARASFAAAQSDPQVAARAPDELNQARLAMEAAEQAWRDRRGVENVEHYSYLTIQRVVIAQQTATASLAQDVVTSAAAERERIQLNARTAEAEAAQRALQLTQQQRNAAELAAADAQRRLAENQRQSIVVAQDNTARINQLEAELRELNAQPSERGMVVVLGDVLFETGEATLLPGVASNIARLAEFFRRNPEQRATIEGYTDNVGTPSSNYALSQRRADAVRDALIREGVSPTQLSTRAYGPDNPVASNGTPTGRQMNRRVEIVFTSS
jgi:outer membrane protein OmpA-like peptidoglycan-associated protein